MGRVPPTREELVAQLHQQIGYLERSANLFDLGYEEEGPRLAVTLRVLLHDTSRSHSLLGQLGVLDDVSFEDTSSTEGPRVEGETLIVSLAQPGLITLVNDPRPRYVAPLGQRPTKHLLPFHDWWLTKVATVHGFAELLSRWDLIDAMAHQDGGAHVDRRGLDERYKSLATMGYGFFYMDLPEGAANLPDHIPADRLQVAGGNAGAASVRQITYEFLATVVRENLLARVTAPPVLP